MSSTDNRKVPWKTWPECAALYGGKVTQPQAPKITVSEVVTPLAPRTPADTARMQSDKGTICGGVIVNKDFAKGYSVGNATEPKEAPVAPKTEKIVRTVSLYERVARIEHSLEKTKAGVEAINADLAKGLVTRTLEAEVKAVEAKLPPPPPPAPKVGDHVWLKSSGKGPFVLVGDIPSLEIETIRDKHSNMKSRFYVEGYVARRVGDGKAVALPKEDVTLVKPVFPTLVGRAIKYSFVALGLTTLLTASLAFGRMVVDRAARGPENVAPVKTSSNF